MFVSVAIVRGIVAELEHTGVATESLFKQHALTPQLLADMQTNVRFEQYARIVAQAVALADDPGLGLRVGSHAPELLFQLVAQLTSALPTLRAALLAIERYSGLLMQAAQLQLHESGGVCELRYNLQGATDTTLQRFGSECLSAVFARLAQRFLSPGEGPRFVGFRHAEPAYAERYAALFRCPVHFAQTYNAVAFDSCVLDRAPPYADRSMADILTQAADRMLLSHDLHNSLSQRVRMMLRCEEDLCNVDTERLAHDLGLSHRVMRRRLASEGQSWSGLLEEARVAGARASLQRPGSTIKDTAERLGYSEPSAFHRAFKRWTGETPAHFMREHGGR